MQSVSTFMYTSVFVYVAGKIKNIGPLKDMGFLCFHHAPSTHQLSTVDIYFIRYILWIDMSEVLYIKKKLFEDKWVNNINKVYEISRYFKFFFLFNKSKTPERFFRFFILLF